MKNESKWLKRDDGVQKNAMHGIVHRINGVKMRKEWGGGGNKGACLV